MARFKESGSSRLNSGARMLLIALGGVLLAMLATAAWLAPDARGYGTHQKLGLPPCTFQLIFGGRCPSCGMTTSWAHFVRGEVTESVKANAGGAVLAMAATVVAPWSLACGLLGRWIVRRPNEWLGVVLAAIFVTVTLIDWSIRLLSA